MKKSWYSNTYNFSWQSSIGNKHDTLKRQRQRNSEMKENLRKVGWGNCVTANDWLDYLDLSVLVSTNLLTQFF